MTFEDYEPTERDHELMALYDGRPWCDMCERGACLHETWGWRHVSDDFPHGIPVHLDPNADHPVTARRWQRTPLFRPPGR